MSHVSTARARHRRRRPFRAILLTLAATGLLSLGCAGPTIMIRHELPPAVTTSTRAPAFEAGDFRRRADATAGHAETMRAMTGEALAALPSGADGAVRVGGTILVDANDSRSERTVAATVSEAGGPRQIPTLVRKIDVVVVFTLTGSAGEDYGGVEARASYDSRSDPRVIGPLGLGRPDDPDRVPASETVIRELLADCAATLRRALEPGVVVATVQLRPASSPAGGKAFDAIRDGDYGAALSHARTATQARPDDPDAWFNLAAIEEHQGRLADAEAHYDKAFELSGEEHAEAKEATLRVERVRRRKR